MNKREHIKNIINKYTNSDEKVISGIQLANKLGVSIGSVNRWKKGECIPDIELFAPICNIFGISINEFLDIDNNCELSDEDKMFLDKIKNNPALREIVRKL